ncbi:MAG: fibronectin type III domain-containing protein, partial [Clostridiales bacterium]|nr:fibronectin type III domain-containing protein [Clostridiales bacterium]
MAIRTPHYKLEAFTSGEIYSASADRRRFITIDNQLDFMSKFVTSGRISGWEIIEKDVDNLIFSVTAGIGVIGMTDGITTINIVKQTYGIIDFAMQNNKVVYVYIKGIVGNIGGTSGFSEMDSIVAVNLTSPSIPTSLKEVVSLKSYNQLSFDWDPWVESIDPDFSYYSIRRIDDHVYEGYVELEQITDNFYTDFDSLSQDSEYTYQVVSVDFSGNESSPAEIILTTAIDIRVPIAPIYLQVYPSNESIQVLWDISPSDNVDNYRIEVVKVETPTIIEQSVVVNSVADNRFGSTCAFLSGLENNVNYDIIVFAVSFSGYDSIGISKRAQCRHIVGAGEVSEVSVEFERSNIEDVGLDTNLSWKYNKDPSLGLPIPINFIITFLENGVRESGEIIIQADTGIPNRTYFESIQYIPYSDTDIGFHHESIKEYTPYFIIIKTQDNDGNLSNGVI